MREADLDGVVQAFTDAGLADMLHVLGEAVPGMILLSAATIQKSIISLAVNCGSCGRKPRQMQRQRDNPTCADEEHEAKQDLTDPALMWY